MVVVLHDFGESELFVLRFAEKVVLLQVVNDSIPHFCIECALVGNRGHILGSEKAGEQLCGKFGESRLPQDQFKDLERRDRVLK